MECDSATRVPRSLLALAARHFARHGDRLRSVLSAAAGTVFLLTNLSGAALANQHETVYTIVLSLGIVTGFVWLTGYSLHAYEQAARHPAQKGRTQS